MSYEILLFPRTPGQDWVEVLEADESDGPPMDLAALNRGVARFRRIEAGLREHLTEPVRTWAAEDADGDVLGELQTRDSGLRVDLYDRSASVSAPLGDPSAAGHDADRQALLRQAVEIVAAETGYEAYDPQTRASWEGSFDEAAVQASQSASTERDDLWAEDAGPGIDAASSDETDESPLEGQIVDDEQPEGPLDPRAERARLIQERREQLLEERRQPASLRRRGWFNVVFGVIAIGIGLMRQSAGDSGLLTWLFLGVGAFEVFGAWLLFSQARRTQEQDQQPTGAAHPTDSLLNEGPDTPADQGPGSQGDEPDDTTPR